MFHKIRRSGNPVSEWKLNGAPAFVTSRFWLAAARSRGGCVRRARLTPTVHFERLVCTAVNQAKGTVGRSTPVAQRRSEHPASPQHERGSAGNSATKANVLAKMKELNVQLDNLCQV